MPARTVRTIFETIALTLALAGLVWFGLRVRSETWKQTEPLRYWPDMVNAWNWGSRAAKEGYVSLYDRVAAEHADEKEKQYGLDYVPLRLAVMTLWAKGQLAATVPPPKGWQRAYEFNRPLLRLNTTFELLTAAGIFALAIDWSRRQRRPSWLGVDRPLYGVWAATAAFALVWLNPALLISTHGRPTWDVWVLPFYLWAVFAAGRGGWLTAGCLIGVGTMFKGQQLFAVPFFLLWPMMRLNFVAPLKFLLGVAIGVGAVTAVWLTGGKLSAIAFVLAAGLVPVLVWIASRRWPIHGRHVPARWLRWTIPTAMVLALAACVPLFDGSINWLRIGLIYGADKFKGLEVGGASSLAGLLQHHFGWRPNDRVDLLQKMWPGLTISNLLVALYGLCLIPIAWAAARYEKHGDRRFVLATAAIWICYFAVFPRMHERYLLWGAIAAAASVIVGMGPLWLVLLFSAFQLCMSVFQMIEMDGNRRFLRDLSPDASELIRHIVNPTFPGIAWAILLATAVWLWMTVAGTLSRPVRDPPADGLSDDR